MLLPEFTDELDDLPLGVVFLRGAARPFLRVKVRRLLNVVERRDHHVPVERDHFQLLYENKAIN